MTNQVGAAQLTSLTRCPFCGVAEPMLQCVWASPDVTNRQDGQSSSYWAAYQCITCGSVLTAKSALTYQGSGQRSLDRIYPAARSAHEDIPEIARRFLQQAIDTLHAPDAAAVMAGSAVDAMLKEKGLAEGSLYRRIDQALEQNILTAAMAEWAHEVRLGSNRPRHSDAERPHVSSAEAQQSVEFAEALANFLYVLSARINRGMQAARSLTPPSV